MKLWRHMLFLFCFSHPAVVAKGWKWNHAFLNERSTPYISLEFSQTISAVCFGRNNFAVVTLRMLVCWRDGSALIDKTHPWLPIKSEVASQRRRILFLLSFVSPPVEFLCYSAMAHALHVSYVRKASLGVSIAGMSALWGIQHRNGVSIKKLSSLLEESAPQVGQQRHCTVGITRDPSPLN